MRRAEIGRAIGAAALLAPASCLVLASCAQAPQRQAATDARLAGQPGAGADRGAVLVVRPVLRAAPPGGPDAAWREQLLRAAVPDVAAARPAAPLAEVIVRVDSGGLISVVQPADAGLGPGQPVAIGRGPNTAGAVTLTRL